MIFSDDELLPISALQHLVFCERQCALIHVERLWAENQLTVEGNLLHKKAQANKRCPVPFLLTRSWFSLQLIFETSFSLLECVTWEDPNGLMPLGIVVTGMGHLYQGRFKSFPVQSDEHFLTVARYVERNAFAAERCKRPEDWRFGSLHHWHHKTKIFQQRISSWPIRRTTHWVQLVATDFSEREREQLDWSVKRGVPFGNETWVEHIARTFDLESTMRPRGRPRKKPIKN